jgi:hypothetical protein
VYLSSFGSLTSKVIDSQHSLVLVAMLSRLVAPSVEKAPNLARVGVFELPSQGKGLESPQASSGKELL